MTYIWELKNWPQMSWDEKVLIDLLASVSHEQGRLLGVMEGLGFDFRSAAHLSAVTDEIVKSSAIEGELFDPEEVRSSVARKLGMDHGGLPTADRHIEGTVDMILDATRNWKAPLTEERLFDWHSDLFPNGRSGIKKITVASWRDDFGGPMRVISGSMGKEKVHYLAPPAKRLRKEISAFLKWFNKSGEMHPLLAAGIAHLWFVTIHPFEDGNGRIARAIADMMLARSERSSQRFYSMSSQIRIDRADYYDILEQTQRGGLNVTPWMKWFLNCLQRAIRLSQKNLGVVIAKARFWEKISMEPLNERQIKMINKLLDRSEGKITSSKWAQVTKCSQDTASRDIKDLVSRGIMKQNIGGGRSTSYSLTLK